jgi:hypothetical protein
MPPDRRQPGVWSGRHFTPDEFDAIRNLIRDLPQASRAELARRMCALLDWRGHDGNHRLMRARVVMLRMAEAGLITLPPPRRSPPIARPPLIEQAIPHPGHELTTPVHLLGPITIERITQHDRHASRQWNATIAAYHYLGFTPPVGHQLRYRIHCHHGHLALIGFASAAWKVAPRDAWIGWSHSQRIAGLPHIINNTRFLILPWIHVPNLASWILGNITRLAPRHWQQDYGIKPVLFETFVDTNRYTGHCYKVANWIHLGATQGRGRYDRHTQRMAPRKDLWIYPLCRDPKAWLSTLAAK